MQVQWRLLPVLSALALGGEAAEALPPELLGVCEASAAVELGSGVIAVGDDENNRLFIYQGANANPASSLDLTNFLALPAGVDGGIDIEGAARIGDIVYWITSHSLTRNAKHKPERFRFFATHFSGPGGQAQLQTVGRPYSALRDDILRAVSDASLDLADAATRSPERGLTRSETEQLELPSQPEPSAEVAQRRREGGFNIEGLAEGPQGGLLLGFRSPVREGMALIIPLRNPRELTSIPSSGDQPAALFDRPLLVDLGGLGIRSMDRVSGTNDYLITAGPVADGAGFRLFRWRFGDRNATPIDVQLGDLIGEALVLTSGQPFGVLIMSDEGDTERCAPPTLRFRTTFFDLSETAQ